MCVGRNERAATAWSTSITSAAATAVANTRRFVCAASGATTTAAIAACCSGSLYTRTCQARSRRVNCGRRDSNPQAVSGTGT